MALSVDFLADHPVFQAETAGYPFVVVTSPDGANRVYRTSGQRFERRLDDVWVADADGRVWRVTEETSSWRWTTPARGSRGYRRTGRSGSGGSPNFPRPSCLRTRVL